MLTDFFVYLQPDTPTNLFAKFNNNTNNKTVNAYESN